jgi:Holliday junction resolvase
MPLNSRQKGGRGERELVAAYREAGFPDAGRAPYSGADARWKGDIIGVPGYHIECKRTEKLRLYDALGQCESQCGQLVPLLHHRRNGGPWYVTLKLEDWLSVLTEGTHRFVALKDTE